MSKRSRTDFEAGANSESESRQIKRVKKDGMSRNRSLSQPLSKAATQDFVNECPICFEEFTHHIYQCTEGHLLCHLCRPKFEKCPTCRISLSSNIRNRILEQILSTKDNLNDIGDRKEMEATVETFQCCLCDANFMKESDLNQHLQKCAKRKIKCPFIDCQWTNTYDKFMKHAKDSHHTCIGSTQSIENVADKKKQYTFNHAIKFPKDTFSRSSADFVWPKIVRFQDGTQFFILSRFKAGFITVLVRLMTLPQLKRDEIKMLNEKNYVKRINNGEDEMFGNYWIEFRIKEDYKVNVNKNNKQKEDKENNLKLNPLRWPCTLYGITVPFSYDKRNHEILKVHHHIFTKYWSRDNIHSSAILRFQFHAILS